MKSKVFLIFIFLTISPSFLKAQIAFYDAIELRKMVENGQFKVDSSLYLILKKYMPDSLRNTPLDPAAIKAEYRQNPFIRNYFPPILGAALPPVGAPSLSTPSSPLGFDVTTIADGFAKFLVMRTKQELAAAYFDNFRDAIENNKDLSTLFPATSATLSVIGNEIYQFNAYMQTLRESFEKDLSNLTVNLPKVLDNHDNISAELKVLVTSGCFIAEEIKNREHPGAILRDFPTTDLDSVDINLKGAMQTLQLLSESLRDTIDGVDFTAYWIKPEQVKNLFSDIVTFRLYLGLIYQGALYFDNNKPILFNGTSLKDILTSVENKFDIYSSVYRDFFNKLSQATGKLHTLIQNQTSVSVDSVSLELFYNYVIATTELFESTGKIGKLIPPEEYPELSGFFTNIKDTLQNYFNVIKAGSQLVWDIKRRSYASAIVDAVTIYKLTISKHISSESTANSLLKYGTFMATIVQAQNSDQIEEAIEAFALPAGSASIKRNSEYNIALNAYTGLFTGYEAIDGLDDKFEFKLNSFGVTAPIGISFSMGCNNWSHSLFVSVVDLGTVAAFRFGDDTTKQIPTVQLQDIISPGLFYSLGLPHSPVSVNVGVQMGSNIHDVKSAENEFRNNYYLRYSLSIVVDIPLLNFYTKPFE